MRFKSALFAVPLIFGTFLFTGCSAEQKTGSSSSSGGASDASGFTTDASTDAGKILSMSKPNAASVKEALTAAFSDLARYFDSPPVITGAYEDKHDSSGEAMFGAKLKGVAVRGTVTSTPAGKGMAVKVTYCRADAKSEEWNKLLAAASGGKTGKDAGAATSANVRLQTYNFPDNTGSVGVADGWHCDTQSLMSGVTIKGPAKQEVNIGLTTSIITRQHDANLRNLMAQSGAPYQSTLMVADFTSPVEALKELIPQLSRISQRNGGPTAKLDRIVEQKETQAVTPGGKAALITYDFTRHEGGVDTQYTSLVEFTMTPLGDTAWMLYCSDVEAPKAIFQRDLPAMMAMFGSLKENSDVIVAKAQQNREAQASWFAAQQKAHADVVAAFDQNCRAWERNQLVQSRALADWSEVMRGRIIEDTRTGAQTTISVVNEAQRVVERLNERDPGRYREIPLKDLLYPLPDGNRR